MKPSRCKRCGSTQRTAYNDKPRVLAIAGVHEGERHTHIVWRHTCCKKCGQNRVDISYENRG